jgi:hypothetical protein
VCHNSGLGVFAVPSRYQSILNFSLKPNSKKLCWFCTLPQQTIWYFSSHVDFLSATISNTGDLDSTLEYKQYFTSTNLIDSSLLNTPTGAAGAMLRSQAVNVPPTLENSLLRANGFTPNASSDGDF